MEVASDKARSVEASVVILGGWSSIPDCGEMGSPLVAESHISISLCIEITSNEDKPRFPSDGDAVPHHHIHSTNGCYSIGAAISTPFTPSSPHFDPTNQLPLAESGLIAGQTGLVRKAPVARWARRLCSLFRIVWAERRAP